MRPSMYIINTKYTLTCRQSTIYETFKHHTHTYMLLKLLVLACWTCVSIRGKDICHHITLKDVQVSELKPDDPTCASFLDDMNLPSTYFDPTNVVLQDCLTVKRDIDQSKMDWSQTIDCSCTAGFYDATNPDYNGVYKGVTVFFLQTNSLCHSKCNNVFQQTMQVADPRKCSCQSAQGCTFRERNIQELVGAVALQDREHAILLLPDDLLLRAGVLLCMQKHCNPPTPISPRAEILCALHGIDFKRCDACSARTCMRADVQCEQQKHAPYNCLQTCAPGYFQNGTDMRCSRCVVCMPDEFEAKSCSTKQNTVCHACAHGWYLPVTQTDKATCMPCPLGEFSEPGTGECIGFQISGKTTQTIAERKHHICRPGRLWDIKTQLCSDCGPSWYGTPGGTMHATACMRCPNHTHSTPSHGSHCTACPRASVRDAIDPTCRFCEPGKAPRAVGEVDGTCVACPEHSINPTGRFPECLRCNGLSRANTAATACVSCPPHQHRAANGSCAFCADNHELRGDGMCVACTAHSNWELCPFDEDIRHTCSGHQHPKWSGMHCACGCHKCALRGSDIIPLGATLDTTRCIIDCQPGERMRGATLATAVCETDDPRQGNVMSPTNSTDMQEYSCIDDVLLPTISQKHHITPCNSDNIMNKARENLKITCNTRSNNLNLACNDLLNLPPTSFALDNITIRTTDIALAYRHPIVMRSCFFCCAPDYQFQANLIPDGKYTCVLITNCIAPKTHAVVEYSTKPAIFS